MQGISAWVYTKKDNPDCAGKAAVCLRDVNEFQFSFASVATRTRDLEMAPDFSLLIL